MSITAELERIVGPEAVVADKKLLGSFACDLSFVTGKKPSCIARPKRASEVQEIVRLANARGIPLVTRSSTGERFRGDTVPLSAEAVIMDLSGMDAIIRMDKRNKVAMIEPGVTFGMLQAAAAQEGLRLAMPLLPRRTKSVLGSYLEREPHTIPKFHWDMSDPICCLELIFGTGDLFRTGSAAGPGSLEEQWAAKQAQKSPMGPSQTDFMKIVQGSQGTMAIATWATVKLELMPVVQKAFFVPAQNLSELVDFTYAILRPKLPDECFILNNVDLAAILGSNSEEITSLAKNLPPWILFFAIAGCEHFPEERVDYIEQDITEIAAHAGVKPVQRLAGIPAMKFLGLLSSPSDDPYWKLRVRGSCQDIFFLNTLDRAPEFAQEIEKDLRKYTFSKEDLGVYIQPIQQGRNCHIEFTLMHAAGDAEATRRVKKLFESSSRTLADMGGFFSRPYGIWSKIAYARCPDTIKALRKLKNIFDPHGVLNPGRLCFGKEVRP
jgi:FAD/FMN-containing dehydrogenase